MYIYGYTFQPIHKRFFFLHFFGFSQKLEICSHFDEKKLKNTDLIRWHHETGRFRKKMPRMEKTL